MLDLLTLHREQANFPIQQITTFFNPPSQRLKVPDHFFQRKGNLLPRFVFHDFSNFTLLDGRQLDELGQCILTGTADCHQIRPDRVSRKKRIQCLTDQIIGNGIGLIQQFGMRNIIVGDRNNLLSVVGIAQLDRLQSRLTNLNPPC